MNAMVNDYGNPSSTHAKGRAALKLVMNARKQLAKALGCESWELCFTSCGSESDNWALWSGAEYVSRKGGHIISSTVEHDAIRRALDELERRYLIHVLHMSAGRVHGAQSLSERLHIKRSTLYAKLKKHGIALR